MIMIQVRSEADLAKLIDLVKGSSKASQTLRDSSARWENMYFGEEPDAPAVTVIAPRAPHMRGRYETIHRVR